MRKKFIGLCVDAIIFAFVTALFLSGCSSQHEQKNSRAPLLPKIALSATSPSDKINELEKITLLATIENKSAFEIANLKVQVVGRDENGNQMIRAREQSLSTLRAKEKIESPLSFRVPSVDEKTEMELEIKVNSREFGELASSRLEITIIKKVPVINLSVTSPSDEISENKEIIFPLRIKNKSAFEIADLKVQVVGRDENGNQMIRAREQSLSTLRAKEKIESPLSFRVPSVDEKTEMEVEIKVNSREFGELATSRLEITIIKKVPVINLSVTSPSDEISENEKLSFLATIENQSAFEITDLNVQLVRHDELGNQIIAQEQSLPTLSSMENIEVPLSFQAPSVKKDTEINLEIKINSREFGENLASSQQTLVVAMPKKPIIKLSSFKVKGHKISEVPENKKVTLQVKIKNESRVDTRDLKIRIVVNEPILTEKEYALELVPAYKESKEIALSFQTPKVDEEKTIKVKTEISDPVFGKLATESRTLTVVNHEYKAYKKATTRLAKKQKKHSIAYLTKYPQGEHKSKVEKILESLLWQEIEKAFKNQCEMSIFDEYQKFFPNKNGKHWTNIAEKLKIVEEFKRVSQRDTYKGYALFAAAKIPQGKCGKIAKKRAEFSYWDKRQKKSPTPHVFTQIAKYYRDILELDKAIHYFDKAKAHNHPEAYAGLGKLYYDEYGDMEKAKGFLEKAAKLKTSDYEAYLYLCLIHTRFFHKTNHQATAKKAISYCSMAIKKKPRCGKCYRKRGTLYNLILNPDDASRDFKRASELEN